MKIYGHFFSPPANQVRLTASAIGIENEYVHVDLQKGEHKLPEYLAVNPFGRVPSLDDDGFQLAESGAISRYLANKAESALYPNDAKTRGSIDQWMDCAAHHVRANMAKILFNKIIAPMLDVPADEKSITEGQDNLNACLPTVDAALGETDYLVGDTLTIADTAMLAAVEPFEMIGYDISGFENITKWRTRNMNEDWYKKVHAHYGAEMAG
jgi:glutathione S-transferase